MEEELNTLKIESKKKSKGVFTLTTIPFNL